MNVSTISKHLGAGAAALSLLFVASSFTVQAATPHWDVSGDWDISFEYLGSNYTHDLTLTQASDGTLTGMGGYPANGAHTYDWQITSGSVSDNDITFTADYTNGADAVTPLTTLVVTGTIDTDGTLSGTWSDNYQGGARSGTFETVAGSADAITATLAAEDFGVMDFSGVKGYTAGFGLTNATLSEIDTAQVQLYSGVTLLQTNTSTDLLSTLSGSQFSSPFDVFGTFDYAADGYWTNVRESEYGQNLIPTRVVATVTLNDGTVLMAENTNLTGDPTTIFPVTPPPAPAPIDKSECKNGGWKTFTNPTFKNQGQCVAYTNHH